MFFVELFKNKLKTQIIGKKYFITNKLNLLMMTFGHYLIKIKKMEYLLSQITKPQAKAEEIMFGMLIKDTILFVPFY